MSNPTPFGNAFTQLLPATNDGVHERLAKGEVRLFALENRATALEVDDTHDVGSFNGRSGAVTLQLGDLTVLTDSRYVLKSGDTMTGPLVINATGDGLTITATGAAIMTSNYIETGFQFSHFKDTSVNTAPVAAEFYHDTTAGTPVAGDGTSIDLSMDSATVKRQVGLRINTSWTVATDATRTATVKFFVPSAGSFIQALQFSPVAFGAYGVAAVARQLVPTGSTTDTVITALQNLGFFRQT